jgi:hypothetical protein
MSEIQRKKFWKFLKSNASDIIMVDHTWPKSNETFGDVYGNDFSKFNSFCFGSEKNTEDCFNFFKSNKTNDGKPIFQQDKDVNWFFLNNVCSDINVEWVKNSDYCIRGDWNQGNRITNSTEWFEQFPCLKKYFNEDSFRPMVDDQGLTYFENKNPKNGKIYHFYSDGEIWTDNDENTGKKWRCSSQRGKSSVIVEIYKSNSVLSEQIPFDIGGGTSTGGGNTNTGNGNTGGGTPSGWNEHCEGTDANPYKVGCKSANIGKAQGCLGSLYKGTVDDKFGKNTLSAIQQKLGKDTFTIEDLNRKICDIKFDDSDDSSLQNTSDLP